MQGNSLEDHEMEHEDGPMPAKLNLARLDMKENGGKDMAEEDDEEREDFLREFKDKAAKDQFGNSAVSGDHENKLDKEEKQVSEDNLESHI